MKKSTPRKHAGYYAHKKQPRRQAGFADRLTQVYSENHVSLEKLSPQVGCSESSLRQWAIGECEPSVADLVVLCEKTGTRMEWLVYGDGTRRDGAPGQRASIDVQLLRALIEKTDASLKTVAVPAAQRAELIASLYELSIGNGHAVALSASKIATKKKRAKRK